VTYESGISCTNFGYFHGHFLVCNLAWCASCFSSHPLNHFEVKMPHNFNGASLAEVEDEVRFKQAHPGDHLCIPCQCPSCQSQNIHVKGIDPNLIDDLVFKCMVIQDTLDAFWSRSSKTIASQVREAKNMARYGWMLGYSPMSVLGPWALSNYLGMNAAVIVLMRSMEKGKTGATFKYGMARKARATLTILWESSPLSSNDITLSAGLVKGWFVATLCLSKGRWY
jgi:hypothetical protein